MPGRNDDGSPIGIPCRGVVMTSGAMFDAKLGWWMWRNVIMRECGCGTEAVSESVFGNYHDASIHWRATQRWVS